VRLRDWTPPEAPPKLYLRGIVVRRTGESLPDGRVKVEMWGGIGECYVWLSQLRPEPYCPPHTPAGSTCTTCGERLWVF
jgi:hypothetical protein